ncbi:PTS glucitol/sorbitol transporter subunit IIC [Jiella flava]|uniref:PTS glucitol/sorbitol transporter subunit IIC n=1 Tax=Jiella flava TaxID=2816857 RepID=A0A939FUT6_9HYPH|nr:PTS glucitol/sorbitol transporter subunit IIC [Jiella flava]MBO0662348.1 PTS glucitol/sorbitol transporter subunit IIC [Jiella flava]
MVAAHAADIPHHIALAGDHAQALVHTALAYHGAAGGGSADGLVQIAQAGGTNASDANNAASYAQQVQNVRQEEQLSWLTTIGKDFIGVFQKGGETFKGFVVGIIPTLVVLMTAFYALTELIGEQRVHGFARFAGKIALTRYTVLPVLAVFFLTNPMAYTFGTFLEEKHKPAFYDSAVSFVHPILGLFPHANPGEYFVWGGVLVALQELESKGALPPNWHIRLAIFYFAVGVVVIFFKGMLTERITALMARRQKIEL